MEVHYLFYLDKKQEMEPGKEYPIGRDEESTLILPDSRVSRSHALIKWEDTGFILTDLGSTNGTYVNGTKADKIKLINGDMIRIGPHDLEYRIKDSSEKDDIQPTDTMLFEKEVIELAFLVGRGGEDRTRVANRIRKLKDYYNRNRDDLENSSFKDVLTELYNRRFFNIKIKDEMTRSSRYKRDLSLILLDIDHFKHYNDTYGHKKGDDILITVARIIKDTCRTSDTVVRYGGEEMAVILPETPPEAAFLVAEKIRTNIEERTSKIADMTVTVSLGIAQYPKEKTSPEDFINIADKALYTAKGKGRNQSVLGN